MKVTHEVLLLNHQFIQDPVLLEVLRLACEWANKCGLEGIKTTNFRITNVCEEDPLARHEYLLCELEQLEKK